MYQTLHETIRVAGVFAYGKFKPVWFDWHNEQFKISQITLISKIKDGGRQQRLYSIVVGNDVFRLLFDLQTHDWFVEAVWVDEGGAR